ncbi:hypothetical protein [Microcoleus vaginatus]
MPVAKTAALKFIYCGTGILPVLKTAIRCEFLCIVRSLVGL